MTVHSGQTSKFTNICAHVLRPHALVNTNCQGFNGAKYEAVAIPCQADFQYETPYRVDSRNTRGCSDQQFTGFFCLLELRQPGQKKTGTKLW